MKLTKYFIMVNLTMLTMSTTLTITFNKKMKVMMCSWKMWPMEAMNLEMLIFIDYKSLAFYSCVMVITSSIFLYSQFYMETNNKKVSFMKMIILFVSSMTILIFSPNMISMILGWEGLGMTSFILIMFYQNKKSVMSAMYTMVMNRVGDIMILVSMLNMMNLSSWMFNSTTYESSKTIIMFMMIGAFSKSAQIPFSSWLTEAMAAPTPISALVHSSTLVTAGVYLMIRFEFSIKFSMISKIILTVSFSTLLMASVNSLYEWDIKKLVALSTLSQLSIMFISISINLYEMALFHMMMHAMFKALIFLCASSMISFKNSQNMRQMSGMNSLMTTMTSFNFASMALCGFPFMSGFYSKDLIMEMVSMQNINWMFNFGFSWCMATTILYSLKLMIISMTKKSKQKESMMKETNIQIMSMLFLVVPSIMLGNSTNWIMNVNFLIPQISIMQKILPLMMMITSTMLMENFVSTWKTMKYQMKKTTVTSKFMGFMWFLKSMGYPVKNEIMMKYLMIFKNSEKGIINNMIEKSINQSSNISKTWFLIVHKKFVNLSLMLMTAMTMMLFLNSLN